MVDGGWWIARSAAICGLAMRAMRSSTAFTSFHTFLAWLLIVISIDSCAISPSMTRNPSVATPRNSYGVAVAGRHTHTAPHAGGFV
jgi:hypothetical protein